MKAKLCLERTASFAIQIFIFFFLALTFSTAAKNPASAFTDSTQQHDDNKNHFYLGTNPTQLIVLDVELYARIETHKRHSIFIAGGYDFNALDFNNGLDPEDQGRSAYVEEESDDIERYFWGQGPAFRFGYEVKLGQHLPSGFFLSAEFLMKQRNYDHYKFGEGRTLHSESADQMIYGCSFRVGYERRKNKVAIMPFTGIGFRVLHSKVTWPVIMEGSNVKSPAQTFQKDIVIPSLHLGLMIYFKL